MPKTGAPRPPSHGWGGRHPRDDLVLGERPPLLFDDRDVDFGGLSDMDLMRMGGLVAEYGCTFRYARIAVLITGEQARAVVDKWRRVSPGGHDSMIAVFDDEAEALAWLTKNAGRDVDD